MLIHGNLGALLLSAGRLDDAAAEMQRSLDLAGEAGLSGSDSVGAGSLRAERGSPARPDIAAARLRALPAPGACPPPPRMQALSTVFNLAKVKQQQGDAEGAEAAALRVLEHGRSMHVAPASYLKAWAMLRRPSAAQVAEMEEIGKYLRLRRKGGE